MASIAQIRLGLQDALGRVDGLRVSATILSSPSPPQAMIGWPTVTFDETFRGEATYTFPVLLVVSRATDDRGQQQLDTYLEPSGTTSVAAAIHSDPTLGAIVDSAKVAQARPGIVSWGDVDYYQAEFDVEVFG